MGRERRCEMRRERRGLEEMVKGTGDGEGDGR